MDTLFDKESLKAYLVSEKKLTDKTRLPFEFLKINENPTELTKFSNFIYENFKQNINKSLNEKNYAFEERIKRNIVDIIFEQNGLVYIQKSNVQTNKEKTEITSDNYKIIGNKYVSIQKNEPNWDTKIDLYFNNTYTEIPERNYLFEKPKSIADYLKPEKKTGAFVVIQITKDMLKDSSKLYFAAECKQRSRRIKKNYSKIAKYFKGGKKRIKTRRIKRLNRI